MNNIKNQKGSTFDSFLEEEGLLEYAEEKAAKKVVEYTSDRKMQKDEDENNRN